MTDTTHPSANPKDRLLASAIDTFGVKGFHGTTTRDIAAGAGMSPAAVYVHHKSKEDLLYLIALEGHQRTARAFAEQIAATDNPVQQLTGLVRSFVRDYAVNHTLARIVSYELASLAPEHRTEILTIRREVLTMVREVLHAGNARGVFDAVDPDMTSIAVLSLGIDVARWFRDNGRFTPEAVADHYAYLALRMVGAAARP
ncbi:TetR/AcrR family transcriptional regulator [Nocardia sp. NPDC050175]|uniref:TetR/AcrR family transcriptional regulator n=1 Tax=Nocardia sp. NPDC050175 TaxID=3364317 RepID=UPI0037AD027A